MHGLASTLATSELIGRTARLAAVRRHMIESMGLQRRLASVAGSKQAGRTNRLKPKS